MSCKTIFVVCALAFIQSLSAQCIGTYNGALAAEAYGFAGPLGAPFMEAPYAAIFAASPYAAAPFIDTPFGPALGPASLAASRGGGLMVTSASAIAPTGVSMFSENAYDGPLSVSGAIPFLGAVSLEGALPTLGAGAVTYGCGNGNVAILNEDLAAVGFNSYTAPLAFESVVTPFPYEAAYGPAAYENIYGAYGFDGILGPGPAYGFDGIIGPAPTYGFDGIIGPGPAYGFDGIIGPAPAYGCGIAGPFY